MWLIYQHLVFRLILSLWSPVEWSMCVDVISEFVERLSLFFRRVFPPWSCRWVWDRLVDLLDFLEVLYMFFFSNCLFLCQLILSSLDFSRMTLLEDARRLSIIPKLCHLWIVLPWSPYPCPIFLLFALFSFICLSVIIAEFSIDIVEIWLALERCVWLRY